MKGVPKVALYHSISVFIGILRLNGFVNEAYEAQKNS